MNYLEIENIENVQGIYRIKNLVNGKVYVGQSVRIKKRFKEHIYNKKRASVIHKAIQKYGYENFDFKILEIVEKSEDLSNRELYYIAKYNSSVHSNGYNVSTNINDKYYTSDLNTDNLLREKIRKDLIELNSIELVAKKYNYSTRTIYRFNSGNHYTKIKNIEYPIIKMVNKNIFYCIDCGIETNRTARCLKCHKKSTRTHIIPREQLLDLLYYFHNFKYIGELCGVSDNAIRKWCKYHNISHSYKDYLPK